MSEKLSVEAILALNVEELSKEVAKECYELDELKEILAGEEGGQNRKTAVNAIKAAIADASGETTTSESTKRKAGVYVCEGKSLTTKGGIKVGGDLVPEGALSEDAVKALVAKEYLEVEE